MNSSEKSGAEQLFQRGLALHQQGDLAGAAEFYGEAVGIDPTNPDLLHMLGVAAFQLANPQGPPPTAGNVELIADVLFSEYLLPFEVASILLLVAVVGSVVMAKKRI